MACPVIITFPQRANLSGRPADFTKSSEESSSMCIVLRYYYYFLSPVPFRKVFSNESGMDNSELVG